MSIGVKMDIRSAIAARVDHVAKYFWDRQYSCHHVPAHNLPLSEKHDAVAAMDAQSQK